MSKKTLIIQVDINYGTQWGDKNTVKFLRTHCIPSVQSYCRKNNYEYTLIKNSKYEKDIGKFDFFYTKLKHYAFERYYYFNNDYEQTVYIDNDVFIFNEAEALPNITGLMSVKEPDGNSSKIFREVNNLESHHPYYNSGVIMTDHLTSSHLANYMLSRLENYIRAKGKNTDNMMLNEYILENQNNFTRLDDKWNYMPFLPNAKIIHKPNFFHFVGVQGKELIKIILDNGFEINDFLKNATFQYS